MSKPDIAYSREFELQVGIDQTNLTRTIKVAPDRLDSALSTLLASDFVVNLYGGLYVERVVVRGFGKCTAPSDAAPGDILTELSVLPKWGVDGTTDHGGYEIDVTLNPNPASSQSASQGQAQSQDIRTAQPSSGGVITASIDWVVTGIPLYPASNANPLFGDSDFQISFKVYSRTYNYRWSDFPSIQLGVDAFDYVVGKVNSKKYTVPIFNTQVDPAYLLFEAPKEELEFTFADGQFRRKVNLSFVMHQRLDYTWNQYITWDSVNNATQIVEISSVPKSEDFNKFLGFLR